MENPCKILIVDDIVANLKLLSSILKNVGYEIVEAEDGATALRLAVECKPHLVLLDIMMPGMDGFETCRKLKENPETANITVIFVSAKNTVSDKVHGLEMSAVDFIAKPFHKTEVIARVKTHLELEIARRKLKRNEENHRILLENVKDGILIWNYSGILFVNQTLSKMLGCSIKDIENRKLDLILSPEEVINTESLLSSILLARKPGESSEISLKMRSSQGDTIITNCFPCFINYNGEPAILVTIRDMTERISLERQLNQAQKVEALGLLTSGIAHDFNNILALINGYTELSLMETEPGSPIQEKLKIVLEAGRSGISLTKGLLSFGRKKNMELKPVDVTTELKRVYGFLQRGLPKNIQFILDIPDGQFSALLDTGQFEQVIVNLCLNARDAMKEGGVLKISLGRKEIDTLPPHAPENGMPGPHLIIEVSDNGCGISDDIIDNIFNPFFTTKSEGTGLGLAMVDRITRNHKGWIEYETAVGQGSKFRLIFPELTVSCPEQLVNTSYIHEHHANLNRILVVDDDEMQTSMLQHFLEKENYQVQCAHSSQEALAMVEKDARLIKLAILDNVMPGMSGTECAKIIRRRWPAIKILVITGAGDINLVGDKLLRKPFTALDLLVSLDELAIS